MKFILLSICFLFNSSALDAIKGKRSHEETQTEERKRRNAEIDLDKLQKKYATIIDSMNDEDTDIDVDSIMDGLYEILEALPQDQYKYHILKARVYYTLGVAYLDGMVTAKSTSLAAENLNISLKFFKKIYPDIRAKKEERQMARLRYMYIHQLLANIAAADKNYELCGFYLEKILKFGHQFYDEHAQKIYVKAACQMNIYFVLGRLTPRNWEHVGRDLQNICLNKLCSKQEKDKSLLALLYVCFSGKSTLLSPEVMIEIISQKMLKHDLSAIHRANLASMLAQLYHEENTYESNSKALALTQDILDAEEIGLTHPVILNAHLIRVKLLKDCPINQGEYQQSCAYVEAHKNDTLLTYTTRQKRKKVPVRIDIPAQKKRVPGF